MRKLVSSCSALFLFAALLSAQISFEPQSSGSQTPGSQTASSTPADQKCVVQGRVLNAQTGEPLKKVSVRMTRRGTGGFVVSGSGGTPVGGQGYSATSDGDGNFRIENIDPGDYTLSGRRDGYLSTQYGATRPMQAGTTLTLHPGQQMTDISLALFPQAVISGKVIDEDGDPVSGAMIQVMRQSWMRGKLRYLPNGGSQTNDLGEFRAANLAPGKYYVCAQKMNAHIPNDDQPAAGKPDIRPVRTCYPDAVNIENATLVEITAGQDAAGTDIRMHSAATYHVRGRIAGALPNTEGQRASVNISAKGDQMFLFGGQGNVDKDQKFDLAGVAPGSYTLNVWVMGGPIRSLGHQDIEVGQGDVNDVIVPLISPGSLRGQIRIEGTPQAGSSAVNPKSVHVNLTPADLGMMFGGTPRPQVSTDGSFTMDNVTPAKYYVQASAPNGTYVKNIYFGQQDVLGKELDLSQGATGNLEIVLRYGPAEVDGTVQPAQASSSIGNSTGVQNASVVLLPDVLNEDGSGTQFGNTDQNGAFTIKQIPPGHYRAYAFEQIDENQLENPEVVKELENIGTEVEVKENDRKQIQLPLITADQMQQIFAKLGIDTSQ